VTGWARRLPKIRFSPEKELIVLSIYCSDCDRLLNEYARLTMAYSAEYTRLSESDSNRDVPEHTKLKNAANQIRTDLETARLEFERHKLIHLHSMAATSAPPDAA